jgi:hypothetical protein
MRNFREFLETSERPSVLDEIVEHLVIQSPFVHPAKTLNNVFLETYGRNNVHYFNEAFESQPGMLGSIWQGIKGAGQAAMGKLGVGGGAALGGLAGSALGPLGTAAGAAAGASLGGKTAGWATQGWDKMKKAWQNMHVAHMKDSYKNAHHALDSYINAMKNIPAVQGLSTDIEKLKKGLETISTKIEKQLQAGGPTPRPIPAPSPRPEPTGTGPRGEPEF